MSNRSYYHWNRADYVQTSNSGWPNYTITTSVGSWLVTMLNWRNGSSNPMWKRLVRARQNATGSLTGQLRAVETKIGGDYKLTDVWGDGSIMQEKTFRGLPTAPDFATPLSDYTTADNAALRMIHRRIRDQRSSFQGQVFLGELRESINMIKSPAKALRQGLSDYLSTATKRARSAPRKSKRKVVAETWLEYSFGWVPLVSDISNAVKAYEKHVNKTFLTRITSQGNSSSSIIDAAGQRGSNANFIPLRVDRTRIFNQSVRYIVGLEYTITGANPDVSVFERAGLTFREFVPTLWELTPWSFLVDYFTNVGDILEAGATDTSSVRWVCRTKRGTAKVLNLTAPDTTITQQNRTVSGSPSYFVTSVKNVQRDAPGLNSPSFQVSLPVNPIQWINMAALAQGVKAARQSFL